MTQRHREMNCGSNRKCRDDIHGISHPSKHESIHGSLERTWLVEREGWRGCVS